MKKFSSVWLVLVTLPIFVLADILAWLSFDSGIALFISLIILQTSVGLYVLWLAVRSQRANTQVTTLIQRSQRNLDQVVSLNSKEIRRIAQNQSATKTHPRELRAIDDIEELKHGVAKIRESLKNPR